MRSDVSIDVENSEQLGIDIDNIGKQLELMWKDYIETLVDIKDNVIVSGEAHEAMEGFVNNVVSIKGMFEQLAAEVKGKNDQYTDYMKSVDQDQTFAVMEGEN